MTKSAIEPSFTIGSLANFCPRSTRHATGVVGRRTTIGLFYPRAVWLHPLFWRNVTPQRLNQLSLLGRGQRLGGGQNFIQIGHTFIIDFDDCEVASFLVQRNLIVGCQPTTAMEMCRLAARTTKTRLRWHLPHGFFIDLGFEPRDGFVKWHRPEIAVVAIANRNRAVLCVARADDQQVRQQLQATFANF